MDIFAALTARVEDMKDQLVAAIEKQNEILEKSHEEIMKYEMSKLATMHEQRQQDAQQHQKLLEELRKKLK